MNIEKNYQEEYEQLKKDFDALHKRYVDARHAAIERSELAARLASNKTMLLYRKAQVKTGKGDPFAQLRPLLSQAEAKIICNIDHIADGLSTCRASCRRSWSATGAVFFRSGRTGIPGPTSMTR